MPTNVRSVTDPYRGIRRSEMVERLARAEAVCLAYGWCIKGVDRSVPGQATHELYLRWAQMVGRPYASREAHPDLFGLIGALAAMHDADRAAASPEHKGKTP